MDQRFFHGDLTPADIADALVAEFDRGALRAQVVSQAAGLAVQIATGAGATQGGKTALTVTLQSVPDGVLIRLGQQEWIGTAASLGRTTIAALRNPWSLIGRLDDIAQDLENMQLSERVWNVIDQAARARGAVHELSERLKRLACGYCGTANSVSVASCVACGAPMGAAQPRTCPNCGYVVTAAQIRCPNCGHQLKMAIPEP